MAGRRRPAGAQDRAHQSPRNTSAGHFVATTCQPTHHIARRRNGPTSRSRAAPTLTHDGRCSACHGVPTSICQGEVQVCRGCLAVLWHLRRPAATPKHRPPAEPPSAGRGAPKPRVPELVVPVPSAKQRAIDAVVRSPEKSDRRIAAETGLDRATIAKARGQLDEYQPVDMPRAETPQSSDAEPPPEPAPRAK